VRRLALLMALVVLGSALAFVVYMVLFGIGFAINNTYFPELRDYIHRLMPWIMGLTWVACVSTTSLIYLLVRDFRKARKLKEGQQ
jgi:hypothetical protein